MAELKYIKRYVERKLEIDDISKNSRLQEYVVARTLYFSLARKYTKFSLNFISEKIKKDHSTVSYCTNVLHGKYLKDNIKYNKLFKDFDSDNLIRLDYLKNEDIDNLQELKEQNDCLKIENENLKKQNEITKNGDLLYLISRFEKLTEENKNKFLIRVDAILNMMK